MKRILIVGATSGIGEGLARLYAERGEVKIGVMGRRSGRLKDLCASRPDVFEAEVCVCDLAAALSMTQSAISHQLRILKQNKLVKCRREGKSVFYSLADDHVRSIIAQGREHIEEDAI